ncbi:hypothetical protein EVAR_71853_1 [Eumeta japonica]|uniref:Uncharacterized protein n=1 Tax=Eumeta variegata TaxID=151549 RepID=A0A4C1TCG5_EUMVA|nr:hypothetical protein EVAR_71853_1 [Eumeta japonica]
MDARKSYSERHLVTFETTLKQTAINNTMPLDGSDPCYLSEDDISFNDNNIQGGQYQDQNIPPPSSNKQRAQSRHQQANTKSKYYQQQSQQTQIAANSGSYTRLSHPNQLSWSSLSINRLKRPILKPPLWQPYPANSILQTHLVLLTTTNISNLIVVLIFVSFG